MKTPWLHSFKFWKKSGKKFQDGYWSDHTRYKNGINLILAQLDFIRSLIVKTLSRYDFLLRNSVKMTKPNWYHFQKWIAGYLKTQSSIQTPMSTCPYIQGSENILSIDTKEAIMDVQTFKKTRYSKSSGENSMLVYFPFKTNL